MKFKDYVKSKKIIILIQIFINLLIIYFNSLQASYDQNLIVVLVFINLSFITYFLYYYLYFKKIIKKLSLSVEELDQKFLVYEIQKNLNYEEDLIFKEIDKISKSQYEDIKKLKHVLKAEKDNKLMWVHEIKQPLAILKEKEINEFEKQKAISKINNNLNMILFYEKVNEVGKDLFYKKENLKELINESLKNYSYELIDLDTKIKIDKSCDVEVLTDKFWFIFILNQIINNSIKYRSEEILSLNFFVKENDGKLSFSIEDNGIGIEENDIKYIFDKGYRGTNAKGKTQASGYGLYYVNKIIKKLNASIMVLSNDTKGITIKINILNKKDK